MTDITKTVSHLIESQFPGYYRENGAELVAFIKAYYEFLESTDKYSVKMSKQMFEISDIDDSLNAFLLHFQNMYLADFPSIITSDKRFAIKHILDLYSSKGSKNSLELLMKLLYKQEVDIYYPAEDILKPSDSLWVRPQYLEVSKTARSRTFLNQQIVGSQSGAKGFVESVITKRVDGKLIDILYLSSIEGQFKYGEKITDDGNLTGAPTITGSLTSINITAGGRNNKVGDILDVVTDKAKYGKVRVTEVKDFTGKVNFEIDDGGYGYTSAYATGTSDFVANTTKVYVSTALLTVNNSANSFVIYEPVLQRIEKVYLFNSNGVNSNTSVGGTLRGYNSSNVQVANSVIISVANTDANGDIISANSANCIVTVQLIGDTTFDAQRTLTLTSNVAIANGEYVDEESIVVLTVSNTSGFTNGTSVYQDIRDPVSNTLISKAIGVVNTSTSSTITLVESWGTFAANGVLYKSGNTDVNTSITDTNITTLGARGLVTSKSGANVNVRIVYGAFTDGKKIRGNTTKIIGTISSNTFTGATTVYLNANTADANLWAPAGKQSVYKLYANGIIVGQNTTAIGIYGNTNPFYYSDTGTYYIETNRERLISPPRYPNNAIMELNVPIIGMKSGSGASFKVGYLENTETVSLNTDLVGSTNVANVSFLDILVSGANSGIGSIANVVINSGGTGYSNGAITFNGGGLADGDPWVIANASITTDGSGVITGITFTNYGEGYYTVPTWSTASGSGANLTINMAYGYGFVKSPILGYITSGVNTIISDVLTNESFIIGSIGTITRINPGSNYNVDPFIKVYNPYIAGYRRGDFYLVVNNVSGSFKTGDTIEQPSTGAKGSVISFDVNTNLLKIHRTSFNSGFSTGYITNSSGSGTVISLYGDNQSNVIGDNAVISGNVIVANGVATAVEVIDSGFGYMRNGSITLESANNPYIMTGTTNILKQGIGTGYWATTSSHLNSEKKIHDNKYYQEYSYEIISGISLNTYKDIVKKVLHIAGNEIFGAVEIKSSIGLTLTSPVNTPIEKETLETNYLILNNNTLLLNEQPLTVTRAKQTTEKIINNYLITSDGNSLLLNGNTVNVSSLVTEEI